MADISVEAIARIADSREALRGAVHLYWPAGRTSTATAVLDLVDPVLVMVEFLRAQIVDAVEALDEGSLRDQLEAALTGRPSDG